MHSDAAGGRLVAAGDHLEQRRLAGAVRPHHADDRRLARTRSRRPGEKVARSRRPARRVLLAQALEHEDRRAVIAHTPSSSAAQRASSRSAARRAVIDDAAAIEHVDAVGDRARLARSARRPARRCPRPSAARSSSSTSCTMLRRQALARLVEQHEARARRAARARSPPSASRRRRGSRTRGRIRYSSAREDLEHLLASSTARKRVRLMRDREVALDRQRREDAAVVGHPADARARDLVRRRCG